MTNHGQQDDDLVLSAAEADFVASFRERASALGWSPCLAPEDWYAGMDIADQNGRCMAWNDIVADNVVVLTVGACFDGRSTRVGELDSQLFTLMPTDAQCSRDHFDGSVQDQGRLAAEWVYRIIRRPIERRDWSRVAHEYRFADDGTPLVVSGGPSERTGSPSQILRVQSLSCC